MNRIATARMIGREGLCDHGSVKIPSAMEKGAPLWLIPKQFVQLLSINQAFQREAAKEPNQESIGAVCAVHAIVLAVCTGGY